MLSEDVALCGTSAYFPWVKPGVSVSQTVLAGSLYLAQPCHYCNPPASRPRGLETELQHDMVKANPGSSIASTCHTLDT